MQKLFSIFLSILLILVLFTGCEKITLDKTGSEESTDSLKETSSSAPARVDFSVVSSDMFTERDLDSSYNENKAISVKLSGDTATASSSSVKISGSTVTITENSTHIISGSLDDGMIIVDASDTAKLQIVLKDVDITSSNSAPIYIKTADKVFITMVGDNYLTSGESFEDDTDSSIDATIFSRQDLTFNGEGSLTVDSPAGHGIVGKDDLVFTGGSYTITSAAHSINANDSVRIKNITLSADSGKDGIHAENSDDTSKGFVFFEDGSITIESEGDGISSGSYMQIEGGDINITAGGGYENGSKSSSDNFGMFGGGGGMHGGMKPGTRNYFGNSTTTDTDSSTSMKGIKSENSMLISGGNFSINSADDSIHSNVSATINGGEFEIASGDDALHAEDTLTVTGGEFNISASYEGLEALHISVSGGNIMLVADDDGLNAAGGTDSSGTTGGRDGMFGGGMGGMGGSSNGSIVISGGNLYINASGDGIDANGTLEITGGYTTVVGPTHGDTATLDYDKSATITGGTFVGTGASNMAQSFSSSSQGVIAVSVGSQSANTEIVVKDSSGNEILVYSPELSFQVVIISTPKLKSGEKYSVNIGGSSGEFEAS